MSGNACLSQVLKADDLYRSMMYCLRMGRLVSVGSQGRRGACSGGRLLVGQVQVSVSESTTPLFLHVPVPDSAPTWEALPKQGKSGPTMARALRHASDKYVLSTLVAT